MIGRTAHRVAPAIRHTGTSCCSRNLTHGHTSHALVRRGTWQPSRWARSHPRPYDCREVRRLPEGKRSEPSSSRPVGTGRSAHRRPARNCCCGSTRRAAGHRTGPVVLPGVPSSYSSTFWHAGVALPVRSPVPCIQLWHTRVALPGRPQMAVEISRCRTARSPDICAMSYCPCWGRTARLTMLTNTSYRPFACRVLGDVTATASSRTACSSSETMPEVVLPDERRESFVVLPFVHLPVAVGSRKKQSYRLLAC
jgi:hypothetical protein